MRVTKIQNYQYLVDSGAGFLANVVFCRDEHKSRSAHRLKCLAKLSKAGFSVGLGPFSIRQLIVDGEPWSWERLDKV